jgi:hypothetical protein
VIALIVSAIGLLAAAVACEMSLQGLRIQSGFSRAFACFAFIGLATAFSLDGIGTLPLGSFLVLWIGGFLFWLGARSHIESSILLRMLYLLLTRARSQDELLDYYEEHYDLRMRVRELRAAGLVSSETPPSLTAKGKLVIAVVRSLR